MAFPGRDAVYSGNVNGSSTFKEVVAKRSDLLRLDGGRLKGPASGVAKTYAGTVLGYAVSGPDMGLWKPAASGASDGSQNAAGVLQDTVEVDSLGNGSAISIIKGGTLYKDLLIGYDAAAKTALKASESVEHGVNLVTILA